MNEDVFEDTFEHYGSDFGSDRLTSLNNNKMRVLSSSDSTGHLCDSSTGVKKYPFYRTNSLPSGSSTVALHYAFARANGASRSRSSSISSESSQSPSWFRSKFRAPVASVSDMQATDEGDGHITADEMDENRKKQMAYEYLCHLEEAKKWIESCIKEELPPTTELEENFRNGVFLAKLGNFFAPKMVPLKRIYDRDQSRYKGSGLHYRHTDNVVQFFGALEDIGLPNVFYPDTADVYDRKNMPKLIYCLHALSLYLHKLGKAPLIQNLIGKVEFTEEEISAMKAELEKYGIQMPAFSKIGGILADKMPVDEAALHAAVIAINEALDKQNPSDTIAALNNPMAHVTRVINDNSKAYQTALYNKKQVKGFNAKNKMGDADDSSEVDVYDLLLTQEEIQKELNLVNLQETLKQVDEALTSRDKTALFDALASPILNLSKVKKDCVDLYVEGLSTAKEHGKNNYGDSYLLEREDIQTVINSCETQLQKRTYVDKINRTLDAEDKEDLYTVLDDPKAALPPVLPFASALYFQEFKTIRAEKGSDLNFDEIHGGIKVLTAVARVNEAIDKGADDLLAALNHPDTHLVAIEPQSIHSYKTKFMEAKNSKQQSDNCLLTHSELQEIIDICNAVLASAAAKDTIVDQINSAVINGGPDSMHELLSDPYASFESVNEANAYYYYLCLKRSRLENEGEPLSWSQIQNIIHQANAEIEETVAVAKKLAEANQKIDGDDAGELCNVLQAEELNLEKVLPECADDYLSALKEKKAGLTDSDSQNSKWLESSLQDGTPLYYDVINGVYTWSLPHDCPPNNTFLTRSEIQEEILTVTSGYLRATHLKDNEDKIIKLQAQFRGYKARRKYVNRLNYLKEKAPEVVKIQAYYRGRKQRKEYLERLTFLNENEPTVVKLQSYARMFLDRKHYQDRLAFLRSKQPEITKIQAAWRGKKTRDDYNTFMHSQNPPLHVVRKFIALLDQSEVDYAEEIELQKQRQAVVAAIKANQQLEKDLQAMDLKIGLLVKNRISIEEVVHHEGKLAKSKEKPTSVTSRMSLLTKDSQERLNAYSNLFYQLQIKPQYLAALILEMPQQQSNKFIESVILTLYNYASNPREEYLLLKLFSTSLRKEIMTQIENISDIVTGNPLAVKMVVDFHRNGRGHSYLRQMLHPLITSFLGDESIKINTNPIEIYKAWLNQHETDTGVASGLPYDVTTEEALKNEQVQKRIEESMRQLKVWSDKFLELILSSLDQIPYGMRYVAKVMFESLKEKFPQSSEKDILKIVGNLLYYRYINSTIVAPDAYGIIDTDAEKGGLSTDQRRNLGSIAKVLQFAAANIGFGAGDSQHLAGLNDHIKESHEKFKDYFRKACNVDIPESYFNINEYSDYTLFVRPQIVISVGELISTHTKLLEYQQKIAPDAADILHGLLTDLGEKPPTLQELGAENEKEELILYLSSNEAELQSSDQSLLVSAKQLVIDIVRCTPGDNLTEVLNSSSTPDQEVQHLQLISLQERVDQKAEGNEAGVKRQQTVRDKSERKLPLQELKPKVKDYLAKLAASGFLKADENYQDMVNLIAKDIKNLKKYRSIRKKELQELGESQKKLDGKKNYYLKQVDYYNEYVRACLANLNTQARRNRASYISVSEEPQAQKKGDKKVKKQVVKYSASKLQERNIILEIEGISPNQMKGVFFEISTTDSPGVFDCTAKFLTVSETHPLKLQDLLHLQYEGVAVTELFERVKVNVNLLIHFLNKKFYRQ